MHPHKTRYVAACQQLLAVGVVVAALVPAASVVTLDIVRETPLASEPSANAESGALAAYVAAAETPSLVPATVVNPTVHQISLTTPVTRAVARVAGGLNRAVTPGSHVTSNATLVTRSARIATGAANKVVSSSVLTSTPQTVTGYGTVGVTWEHGDNVTPKEVGLQVRTEKDGVWSDWADMDFDADGPDAKSAEGKRSRPGTMESLVGHVDQVQVRMTATGVAVPPDVQLSVIDPGEAPQEAMERPAIDTSRLDTSATAPDTLEPADETTEPTDPADPADGDTATLSGADVTPEPQIFSRAQWGANEKIKRTSTPEYGEIHGGFVHHTVNANNYTKAEVPAIIRSIYAYHVQSRGWNDVGYNFLIDKFGRIWEGRYGGVDRPVVGAHTESYNYYGFGVSAIGNFDIKKPPEALIQAEGALFAWKLSLHGVSASATNVAIGPRTFSSSIMAHRDTKSTACPGRYLYARMDDIRALAASVQHGWEGRNLDSDLAGSSYPDLVVRRASDGEGFVIPTNGLTSFAKPTALEATPKGAARIVSPDLGNDGVADLVVISADGTATVRSGVPGSGFGTAAVTSPRFFAGRDLVTPAGDLNADGHNDLVGRNTANGHLMVFLGKGNGTFRAAKRVLNIADDKMLIGAGDVTGDKRADLLELDDAGQLWLSRGGANAKFVKPKLVAGTYGGYSAIKGPGDLTGDGIGDLLVRSASTGDVSVLPGTGKGGFGAPLGPITSLKGVTLIGTADFDRAGLPEIFGTKNNHLVVSANDSTADLGRPIDTGVNFKPANLVLNAGDWDGDGDGDIIMRGKKGVLWLYPGDGSGLFTSPRIKIGSGFNAVKMLTVAGDITGDGLPDLQGQLKRGAMMIWPGRGTAGLGARYVSHSAIAGTAQIAVGRWDADGAPDSLVRLKNGTLTVYRGNGPGGLMSPTSATPRISTNVSAYDWVIGVSDIGGDGHPDLIVRNSSTGDLYELPGKHDGSLGTPVLLGTGMEAYDLAG